MKISIINKQGISIECTTLDTKIEKSNYFKRCKETGRSPLPFIAKIEGKNIVIYEILNKVVEVKEIDLSKIVIPHLKDLPKLDISSSLQGKEYIEFINSSEIQSLYQYCGKCLVETNHKTKQNMAICCICNNSYQLV